MFGKKNVSPRRLKFESLEPRAMLAGNITASLDVNGNIIITGDGNNNDVAVFRGAFGQVLVSGGRSDGTATTRTSVNGQFLPRAFNTSGGIILNLGNGNDRVLVTNYRAQGNITGSLGNGNDEFAVQSTASGAISFVQNDGTAPPYDTASVSGLISVNADAGDDVLSFNDAIIGGAVTFNMGDGTDSVEQFGTAPETSVIGGNFTVNGGLGDDTVTLMRLSLGNNLLINDGPAITGSTVALTNVRANLDIQLFLSIFDDNVIIEGEDNGTNRFQARNLVLFTGNGNDLVTVTQGIMVNCTVDTGAGDEGNGFFGVEINQLAINTQLLVDLGDGFDNALIDTVTPNILRVFGRSGSDGIIAQNISAVDALFDSAELTDILGLYDSFYDTLDVLLAAGNDRLYAGGLTVNGLARFDGGTGFNTYFDVGGNSFGSLQRINI